MSDTKSTRPTPFAALLRAVNLAGRNRVPMAELRAIVAGLGGEDAQTYVQSGNVVFRSARAAGELERELRLAIAERLGLDIAVIVRTGTELARIAKRNPFTAGGADEKTLHVAFLADRPAAACVRAVDPAFAEPDELRVAGREVYLRYPDGYGRTKLTNAALERRLGVAATTRNWRTVTALAAMAAARR